MASHPPVQPRTVLVTGCSTGIGAATAVVLRDRGWQVLPTARRDEDLERLRGEGFTPIALDVTDSTSIGQAVTAAQTALGATPGAVVNNAGFGQPGAVEDLTRDAIRRQFEVNLFGLQELTNLLIPGFRDRGHGRIVNVSSVLGRISMPFNAAYSASKFALEALSDGLRVELHGSGIAVSLIEPGPIESAFRKTAAVSAADAIDFDRAHYGAFFRKALSRGSDRPHTAGRFALPPEAVAAKIAHALESSRPRRRYGVTTPAYIVAFARRFLPDALIDALYIRMFEKRKRQLMSS